jgi:hypothetical protein
MAQGGLNVRSAVFGGSVSRVAESAVGTRVVHPADDEWEVQLASSGDCVGYVTRYDELFEAIDVLPPYEVTVAFDLDHALQCIYATLDEPNGPIIAAYAACPARRAGGGR